MTIVFCKEYLPWSCKVKINKSSQLPLSFLSSLFALDVSVFPHESGDLKYPGWWIFPMICMPQLGIHILCKNFKSCANLEIAVGISACVSSPLIYAAFNVNGIIKSWEQFKRSRSACMLRLVPIQPDQHQILWEIMRRRRLSGNRDTRTNMNTNDSKSQK